MKKGVQMAYNRTVSIAVVCGGPSAETDVSRVSGRCIADALRTTYTDVRLLEFDHTLIDVLKQAKIDVVFPALHGPMGEDGCLQGLLEILGIPYVGNGVLASACALDKTVAKQIFRGVGLPVARDTVVSCATDIPTVAQRILDNLGPSVVVKPARQGSALGVQFAQTVTELISAIEHACRFDEHVLVEENIKGREITAAILERNGIEALPIVEITVPNGAWYDYEHRYTQGLSTHLIPAPLPESQYQRVAEIAVAAHEALRCRDLSRVDFIVPAEGDPIVLEVNTLPGMTPTSLYPDAARAAGLSFPALCAHLVERALGRTR
jgi:D-alanine-D-alanine ligase